MSQPAHLTPRSGKFTSIKSLQRGGGKQAATQLAVAVPNDVRETVVDLQARREWQEFDTDAELKIRRHRYAQLIVEMIAQGRNYHSVGLFVETMLRDIESRVGMDAATRAAIATWGLNILAKQSTSRALESIAKALMPAIYCQFDVDNVEYAPPAIQAQVKDAAALHNNPYFTHSMYVEQVNLDHSSVAHLSTALQNAIHCNDSRRNYVVRCIRERRAFSLKAVFRGWRAYVRRTRILTITSENRVKRQFEATARLRVQAAFFQWKVLLELSRNGFLTERLHEAAFQLENAKNQFQLQCYRADRLIESTKKAKEELEEARECITDLREQVANLKEELVVRGREYNDKLARNVVAALDVVKRYRLALSLFVKIRLPAEEYATDTIDPAASGLENNIKEDQSSETAASSASESECSPPKDSYDEEEVDAVAVLLQWCNKLLHEVQGKSRSFQIRNFGSDFASGEAYLVVLNHVCPDTSSLVLNQETDLEYRLRRIRDMCEKSGLMYVLEPSDFVAMREDRIVQSLCELYSRFVLTRWRANSAQASVAVTAYMRRVQQGNETESDEDTSAGATASGHADGEGVVALEGSSSHVELKSEEGEEEERVSAVQSAPQTTKPPRALDEETFQRYVWECNEHLAALQCHVNRETYYERKLTDNLAAIDRTKVELTTERNKGAPIPLVGDTSTRPFWQINTKSLEDLRNLFKHGIDAQLWVQILEGPLPRLLYTNTRLTSRIFYYYAGEGARNMSEVSFWRFIESSGITGDSLSKETVSSIFDRVASPQLAAILRSASGKSDMDIQTLMYIARQELDIRHITPTQFVEILIRIAVTNYSVSCDFVESITRFLKELHVPQINLLPPVLLSLYTPHSQHVVQYFCDDLMRIFFFYVKRQDSSKIARERTISTQDGGRFAALLSVRTYVGLLADCGYMRDSDENATLSAMGLSGGAANAYEPPATQKRSVSFFSKELSEKAFLATKDVVRSIEALRARFNGLRSGELTFTVYLESFAVLANYWYPDCFIPPSRKLAAFIADCIRQLGIKHATSSLILGAPPAVSLSGGPQVEMIVPPDM